MSFLDEYCVVFDDEDENKLEFTKIHKVGAEIGGIANRIRISKKSWRTSFKN